MAIFGLSNEEKKFMVTGITQDFRSDGRARYDYRTITIDTGIVPNTSASSQVKIGGTHILVGIHAEIGEPLPEEPGSGRMSFFVDSSATAALEGIVGGYQTTELTTELASYIAKTFCKGTFDGADLCEIPGKVCWVLHIDISILEYGGNLLDAMSIGVKAALDDFRKPKLRIIGEGSELDFEVSDDPTECTKLDFSDIPITVTLYKIGDEFLLDATLEEEYCSDTQLIVAVNNSGTVCSVLKKGPGAINPELIMEMIEAGKKHGTEICNQLIKTLERKAQLPPVLRVGFLK